MAHTQDLNSSPAHSAVTIRSGIEPAILYWGTPVVLISTTNEDGTSNLAPISSASWLGRGCMLGLTGSAHSVANTRRTGECVLNLPSADMATAVDRIAKTTGSNPVPPDKAWLGFEYEADKKGQALGVRSRPYACRVTYRPNVSAIRLTALIGISSRRPASQASLDWIRFDFAGLPPISQPEIESN